MSDRPLILWHFVRTRWLPGPGPRARERKWRRFVGRVRRESPFYRDRDEIPVLTKPEFLARFAELNRHGFTLAEATEVALRAERERDFRPELPGGVTVGLSSGTSGTRHVFLVGRPERCRWAGEMFARTLEPASLRQILNPFARPLRLAFFLRASSNLYTTLASRRVRFDYYDLTRPFPELMAGLTAAPPDVIIAPATVLAEIAKTSPPVRPRQVISVAEVLDQRDRALVEQWASVRVAEVYQATEGFLGSSCRAGRIHLNEETLHIERLWIDDTRERFHPVITDLSRTTQWFVRHRLNDVLILDPTPCPCGRRTTTLRAIEGRAEEVLWLPGKDGALAPVFPDLVRQAIYSLDRPPDRYRIEQHGMRWELRMQGGHEEEVASALLAIAARNELGAPGIVFLPWIDQPSAEKQKRIRCLAQPE